MPLETLADAFYNELCDIYYVEKQLIKAIAQMAKKATHESLVQALNAHAKETEQQTRRIEAAFDDTGKFVKIGKAAAMDSLLNDVQIALGRDADPEVMDAVIIGLAQKVEHYEIATYRTLWSWASTLEYKNAKQQLTQNLAEEEKADKALTKVSKAIIKAAELVSAE